MESELVNISRKFKDVMKSQEEMHRVVNLSRLIAASEFAANVNMGHFRIACELNNECTSRVEGSQ